MCMHQYGGGGESMHDSKITLETKSSKNKTKYQYKYAKEFTNASTLLFEFVKILKFQQLFSHNDEKIEIYILYSLLSYKQELMTQLYIIFTSIVRERKQNIVALCYEKYKKRH